MKLWGIVTQILLEIMIKEDLYLGMCFTVGGNVVSWKSNLQHVVDLSLNEAKYIALTEVVIEALWLKGMMSELGFRQYHVIIHCDSQRATHLSKNIVFHERIKHRC